MKVIGIGAAGNKAAANLIKKNVIERANVMLLNTTLKDIPSEYKDISNQFSSTIGGCGKEPKEGQIAITKAITNHKLDIGGFFTDSKEPVILITSTEGGTGSGATPVLVNLLLRMNLCVHVFALIGFNEDARGIKNTMTFFSSLEDGIVLHVIQNAKFYDFSKNHAKAEQTANDEVANQVAILTGNHIIISSQNIDEKDMYKLYTTPGYMDLKHLNLDDVKNMEQFDAMIQNAYTNPVGFDVTPTNQRLGIIINASERTMEAVDESFEVIKRYVGESYEIFKHIQYDEDQPEYIEIIACGMEYPINDIIKLKELYNSMKSKVHKNSSSFKSLLDNIDLDEEDEYDVKVEDIADFDDAIESMKENMMVNVGGYAASAAAATKEKPNNNRAKASIRRVSNADLEKEGY